MHRFCCALSHHWSWEVMSGPHSKIYWPNSKAQLFLCRKLLAYMFKSNSIEPPIFILTVRTSGECLQYFCRIVHLLLFRGWCLFPTCWTLQICVDAAPPRGSFPGFWYNGRPIALSKLQHISTITIFFHSSAVVAYAAPDQSKWQISTSRRSTIS
jgi:hypothetical protein